ncbi:MAG: hypothetical protein AAF557_26065 [Pseudomonadota bacterium]
MKVGASISGGMHAGLLLLAIFGADWFASREQPPLTVTEVEFIDGTEFDAALSTAPVVESEGPAELRPPSEVENAPEEIDQPEDQADVAEAQQLETAPPPDPKPDAPDLQIPPPPTNVPTEEPKPTIAEIPSPDPLDVASKEPESPVSNEPVAPLTPKPAPVPTARPQAPPQPEPEPEEPKEVAAVDTPDEQAEQKPTPDPELVKEPDPEDTEEVPQQAPEGPAPLEAKLPIAKPAELAKAAQAVARQEQAAKEAAEAKERERQVAQNKNQPKNQTTPSNQQAGGSTAVQARKLSRGERNALSIGISKYLNYTGSKSPPFYVIMRVQLSQDGRIVGTPTLESAKGNTKPAQSALLRAGIRAVKRAASAGVFRKLPKDKYPRWKTLRFRLFPDKKAQVS